MNSVGLPQDEAPVPRSRLIVVSATNQPFRPGFLKDLKLAWFLALYDVRYRYARSVLGPFWITLQMAVFIAGIGVVFGSIIKVDLPDFLPFLACSYTMWMFLSGAVQNSTTSLSGASGFVKDRGMPAHTILLQCFFRHVLLFAHNAVVPLLIILAVGHVTLAHALLALPGFLIFGLVTAFGVIIIGTIAARYRDVQPIVDSAITLLFLGSPIAWMPGIMEGREFLVELNPIAHLLAVWRMPLLEGIMPWNSLGISLGIVLLGAGLTAIAIRNLRYAAFWI